MTSSDEQVRPDSNAPQFQAGCCANCGMELEDLGSPLFCSEQCQQAAQLVRAVRRYRADGRFSRSDIRQSLEMRLALVLGGGYPYRERRVPEETRAKVFARANGRCENCGRVLDFDRSSGDPNAVPAIHHADGSSNDAANLRAFCWGCNSADARSKMVPVDPGCQEEQMAKDLQRRWEAKTPLRLCDDEEGWNRIWRGLRRDGEAAILHRHAKPESTASAAWALDDSHVLGLRCSAT